MDENLPPIINTDINPIPPAIPTSPSKSPLGLLIKIVIGVVVLAVVGTGVVLATRIWDPLWNPFRPEPEKVMDEMLKKMKEVKTLHSKIDFLIKGENEQKTEFSLKIEGDDDRNDPESFKWDGKIDALFSVAGQGIPVGGKFALGAEYRMIGKVSYLKLTTLPPLPFLEMVEETGIDFSKIKNQWIKIDQESVQNLIKEIEPSRAAMIPEEPTKIQKEFQEKIKKILAGRKIYLIEKELPDEKIGENLAYHYRIVLNQEEVKKLIPEIWKVMEEIMLKETGMAPTINEKEFQKKFDEFFEKIGKISGEIWIGKKDGYIYKIKFDKEIDLAQLVKTGNSPSSYKALIKLNLEANYSKFGETLEIKPPAEFKVIEDVLIPLIKKK